MRIEDPAIYKWRKAATTGLLWVLRIHAAVASRILTCYIIQAAKLTLAEEALASEQNLSTQNTMLCLERMD